MDLETAFLVADICDSRADELQTDAMPAGRALRLTARYQLARVGQQEALRQAVPTPPPPGESVHVISDAQYDYFRWFPEMILWAGGAVDEAYISTWTLCRQNCIELFQLWDGGAIPPGRVSFLTGEYFRQRETSVYATLLEGIRARGGRYRAGKIHAKIQLVCNAGKGFYLVAEGSANWTANPRAEQAILTNHEPLYRFYRSWFEEVLSAPSTTRAERKRRKG